MIISNDSLATPDIPAKTTKTKVEILPPAEEESLIRRRVADGIPRSVWLLAIAGACERFTYYGLMAPLR
jgi:hypothetical protein